MTCMILIRSVEIIILGICGLWNSSSEKTLQSIGEKSLHIVLVFGGKMFKNNIYQFNISFVTELYSYSTLLYTNNIPQRENRVAMHMRTLRSTPIFFIAAGTWNAPQMIKQTMSNEPRLM